MFSFLVFYAVLGLIVGSFLNVCIYRLPRGESIVFPGSHCPGCSKPLRPYDNIPLFSYLWLRGKCRHCATKISPQYPAVELLTCLAFLGCALRWGPAPPTYVNSLFLSAIVVLVFIDYQHQILPNAITLPGTAAGILLSPFQESAFYLDPPVLSIGGFLAPGAADSALPWVGSILGALCGGGVLFLVGSTYQALRHRQGLGMGDVKMMAFVGAFLGWRLALLTVFAGSCIGTLAGLFLVLFRGKNLQSKLAFGTFLGAGAAIALFYGVAILRWYLSAH
jgi:leader peptidase (prepilin peptidase) / N-methyltransferase